jgi:hypothetical protein
MNEPKLPVLDAEEMRVWHTGRPSDESHNRPDFRIGDETPLCEFHS